MFDPEVPEGTIDAGELRRATPERRRRAARLLREAPIANVQAPLVAALITHLGVRSLARPLRELCADEATPLINRGVAAYLLKQHQLSPRTPASRIPVLAESLLVGCALLGSIREVAPVVAYWLAAPDIDGDALIDRLESLRLAAAAPPGWIYDASLGSAACARHHRTLAAITDAAGAPGPATGRLWFGPPSDSREWIAWAFLDATDSHVVGVQARLVHDEIVEVSLSPLLDRRRADRCARDLDATDSLWRAPVAGTGGATAFARARADDEDAQRCLWLFRRLGAAARRAKGGVAA